MATPKRKKWPKKPSKEEREAQFKEPPVKMPPGIDGAAKVDTASAESTDEDEKSWADTLIGASPGQWQTLPDGTKTAGGPIKHSLCPGCIFLKHDECTNAMPEVLRNNPETVSCANAKPVVPQ